MADYTEIISLPDHKRGDVWGDPEGNAVEFGPILINTVQPTNTLTKVRMLFRKRLGKSSERFLISTDATESPDAPMVIDNATTWEASIAAIENFLSPAGVWEWDAEFFQDGVTTPWTLYKGTITIYDDITK